MEFRSDLAITKLKSIYYQFDLKPTTLNISKAINVTPPTVVVMLYSDCD